MQDPPTEQRSWPRDDGEPDDVLVRLADELRRRREIQDLHRRLTHSYDGPTA